MLFNSYQEAINYNDSLESIFNNSKIINYCINESLSFDESLKVNNVKNYNILLNQIHFLEPMLFDNNSGVESVFFQIRYTVSRFFEDGSVVDSIMNILIRIEENEYTDVSLFLPGVSNLSPETYEQIEDFVYEKVSEFFINNYSLKENNQAIELLHCEVIEDGELGWSELWFFKELISDNKSTFKLNFQNLNENEINVTLEIIS